MDKKRVAIVTFGCQMNVRDSEVIAGLLRAATYVLTADPDDADVVILNTCSVRQHAEDKVWSEVGRFSKRGLRGEGRGTKRRMQAAKPIIGIVGCMAQNYQEKVFERSAQVDFVVGPSDIHKIPGIIKELARSTENRVHRTEKTKGRGAPVFYERKIWETGGLLRPEEIYHTGFYEDKEHAYVVISEGCSNYCAFCVVPYVRGALRHRNYQDILREIEDAVERGITRITLLGQNVNSYRDGDTDFIALLQRVAAVKGLKEFSFITSHPKDASRELFMAMQEIPTLKKYLHLPMQSGSDRVLKLMNRGYTSEKYLALAGAYRGIVKGGVVTTDIIVGYPTETEDDFMDTYNLVKDIQFDAAFIFKYSPRPHTQAAKMVDDVPKAEKERRHALVLELQRKISKAKKPGKP